MNILFITNHLNIGGITSYVLTLTKGLKKKGHNVYVASSGGIMLPRFIEEGAVFIPVPIKTKKEVSFKIAMCEFSLSGCIKRYKIDILHTHSRTTQVLGELLRRSDRIPHIYTCHGYFRRRILRRLFPCWGNKIIAISEQVKDHLISDFGVEENNVSLIHNGIDIESFSSQGIGIWNKARKRLGLGDGPVIGIVARLSDVKGHRYLIEAMPEVLNEVPDAQLLICGEGKEKENLIRITKQLGIARNVIFAPEAQGTAEVLSVMNLFVMPSLKEGLGLALMEAMAAGVPVVGTSVGGIKTLIQDGLTGLLVKPASVSGLSESIIRLLKDTALASTLRENARRFIGDSFSQTKMVDETEKVYRECLNL
jgi:glycosyltransferase involved in cell wall biosynthesis